MQDADLRPEPQELLLFRPTNTLQAILLVAMLVVLSGQTHTLRRVSSYRLAAWMDLPNRDSLRFFQTLRITATQALAQTQPKAFA
jgi:hypothetical protein